jgi:hypothetical protein
MRSDDRYSFATPAHPIFRVTVIFQSLIHNRISKPTPARQWPKAVPHPTPFHFFPLHSNWSPLLPAISGPSIFARDSASHPPLLSDPLRINKSLVAHSNVPSFMPLLLPWLLRFPKRPLLPSLF